MGTREKRLEEGQMRLTTLCYIQNEGRYLMLHRVSKAHDENAGKWIGIGGHIEENESPLDCIRREILEETGLTVEHLTLRGLITFILPKWGNELTFLYTADTAEPSLRACPEGKLAWIPLADIPSLNLWEGDRIFLPLLEKPNPGCFSLTLTYDHEDRLVGHTLET